MVQVSELLTYDGSHVSRARLQVSQRPQCDDKAHVCVTDNNVFTCAISFSSERHRKVWFGDQENDKWIVNTFLLTTFMIFGVSRKVDKFTGLWTVWKTACWSVVCELQQSGTSPSVYSLSTCTWWLNLFLSVFAYCKRSKSGARNCLEDTTGRWIVETNFHEHTRPAQCELPESAERGEGRLGNGDTTGGRMLRLLHERHSSQLVCSESSQSSSQLACSEDSQSSSQLTCSEGSQSSSQLACSESSQSLQTAVVDMLSVFPVQFSSSSRRIPQICWIYVTAIGKLIVTHFH